MNSKFVKYILLSLLVIMPLNISNAASAPVLTRTDEVLSDAISECGWDTTLVMSHNTNYLFQSTGDVTAPFFTLRSNYRITDITIASSAQVNVSWHGTNINMNNEVDYADSTGYSLVLAGGTQSWPWYIGSLGFRVTNTSGSTSYVSISIRGKTHN